MNQERNTWIWVIVAILILIGLFFVFRSSKTSTTNEVETSTSTPSTTGSMIVRPYGEVTLKLGETAYFKGISITPMSIEEDSRCPVGVQCIQAGTVRVEVKSMLDAGTVKTNVIGLGLSTTVDTFAVSFVSVTPGAIAGTEIKDADYRLKFKVHQSAVIDTELIGK